MAKCLRFLVSLIDRFVVVQQSESPSTEAQTAASMNGKNYQNDGLIICEES